MRVRVNSRLVIASRRCQPSISTGFCYGVLYLFTLAASQKRPANPWGPAGPGSHGLALGHIYGTLIAGKLNALAEGYEIYVGFLVSEPGT